MMPKKRRTAVDIAARLPIAELLPSLAGSRLSARLNAAAAFEADCRCRKDLAYRSNGPIRDNTELEAENYRLRAAIAHLTGANFIQDESSRHRC